MVEWRHMTRTANGITVFPGEDPRIVEAIMHRAGCSPLRSVKEVEAEFAEAIAAGPGPNDMTLTGNENQGLPNIYASQDEDRSPQVGQLKVVGCPDDVAQFRVGELVRAHLEMKGKVFEVYPHGEICRVLKLFHLDEEYFYWMPVVGILPDPRQSLELDHKELAAYGHAAMRMFNPAHLRPHAPCSPGTDTGDLDEDPKVNRK